jgi:NADPH-dependent 2,4-dienoyl-CoA reductase/sulfur reductase-like enzyme
MRFSLEVVDAIRGAVGADFIVGARVSGDDRTSPGLEPGELFEIVKRLDATGKLDYFTVVGGTIETYRARAYTIPSAYYPKRTFEHLSRALREVLAAPVILTGRITTPAEAEDVLRAGSADFVGMTRALIADPEMPRKAAGGHADEIRVCMGSGEGCIDRLYFGMPIGCVQNAAIGRESEWSALVPAAASRRVVVVGGGPAGMEAARIAARRGHAVTLYEREAELGGAIRIAARAPLWENYRLGVEWQARDMAAAGVAIETSAEVDLAFLERLEADAFVFATGAAPRRPYIDGADAAFAWTAADVLAGRAALAPGPCVVVDETGYTPGAKTADFLAQRGFAVEILTQQYALGETIGTTLRAALVERLLRAGVRITPLTAAVRVAPGAIVVRHVLTGDERALEAANVIFACGGAGRDDLYRVFVERHADSARPPECRLIGDAFAPRHLRDAVLAGADAGRAL